MLQLKRHYSILMMQAVLNTKSILPLEQSCPTEAGTGSVAAEGRLCWQSWSLYRHRSTVHFSVHLRLVTPNYTSQAWKGEPLLVSFHQCDCPFPCLNWQSHPCRMSMWCSTGGSALAIRDNVFSICITCMWLGRKSCFHTKKSIVFRSISHKILPDKSFTMPSLARNTPIFFSLQLTTCTPCNADLCPSLSHFSKGQSAQTAPWMFRFCRLQKFWNLSFTTPQATCKNWPQNKFQIES